MELRLNKKGMFFTLIVVVLFSIIMVSYALLQQGANDKSTTKQRISTMSQFLFSIEKDLQRQTYIAGFRSVVILEKEMAKTGDYIDNTTLSTKELFMQGTLNNVSQDLMTGVTLSDITRNLQDQANKMNLNISLDYLSFTLDQIDPWYIRATLALNLSLWDIGGLATWNRTQLIYADIPVEGFEDPLYTINTQSKVINRINKTVFSPLVVGADISNLIQHTEQGAYTNSTDAPSFLQRLEGNFNPSPSGIESLVDLQKLSSQSIAVQNKSIVDHIYFSTANPASSPVTGAPTWFRLDNPHRTFYQIP